MVYLFPTYLNSLSHHQNPVNGVFQWPAVVLSSKEGPGGLKTTAEGSPKPLTFSPVQRAPKGTWLLGKGHLIEVMETCVQVSVLSSCVTLDRSLALSGSRFPHLQDERVGHRAETDALLADRNVHGLKSNVFRWGATLVSKIGQEESHQQLEPRESQQDRLLCH